MRLGGGGGGGEYGTHTGMARVFRYVVINTNIQLLHSQAIEKETQKCSTLSNW